MSSHLLPVYNGTCMPSVHAWSYNMCFQVCYNGQIISETVLKHLSGCFSVVKNVLV